MRFIFVALSGEHIELSDASLTDLDLAVDMEITLKDGSKITLELDASDLRRLSSAF